MRIKEKKAMVDTPVHKLNKGETLEHYTALIIEQFNSKMDLVVERLEAVESIVGKKIDSLRDEIVARIENVELAISSLSSLRS